MVYCIGQKWSYGLIYSISFRSRRVNFDASVKGGGGFSSVSGDSFVGGSGGGGTSSNTGMEGHPKGTSMDKDEVGMASVRFNTIVDIGSASFKYDMRKLTEILEFPKAWYRKTLVRRLFLGELKTTKFESTDATTPPTPDTSGFPSRHNSNAGHYMPHGFPSGGSGRRPSVPPNPAGGVTNPTPSGDSTAKTWIGKTTAHSWETLVLFALHFKELKVHMNMGNVMGNVDWNSKDFRSEGRLSIDSTGHKKIYISLGLSSSKLEAKGGFVGGAIDLGRVHTYCHLKEDKGIEPFHQVALQLDVAEVRFDYMSNNVTMGRISHLIIKLKDDWHVRDAASKPAQIFVQGDLSWDQLQLLISKSTTGDLIKICNKVEDFFLQQFKSSKKLIYSLEPGSFSSGLPAPKKMSTSSNPSDISEGDTRVSHHRHWQKVLEKISGMKIYTLDFKLPDVGSVLGGVLELHGKHISLACFYGSYFKSKSWALFSLKEPSISFVSDATYDETRADEEQLTTIIQTLLISLGQSDQVGALS